MAQQAGPFSEYLRPDAQPHVAQPSGWEGKAAGAAYIGAKFLEGLRQGRMQRAALAEQENAKTERAYEQAIHMLDQNKTLDPSMKQQLMTPLMQSWLGHIGGVKESSKDTGHPFTDFVKNAAVNMTGGQLPKAKAPLDMGLIGHIMTAVNDPANNIHNRAIQVDQGLRDAVKTGNILTQDAVYGLPAYQQAKNQHAAMGLEYQPEWIGSLPKNEQDRLAREVEVQKGKSRLAMINSPEYAAMISSGQQAVPQTSAPPPQAGLFNQFAPVGTQGTGTTVAPQPMAKAPTFASIDEAIAHYTNQENRRAWMGKELGMAPPPSGVPIPKLTTPLSYADERGNAFMGRSNPADFAGFKAGIYNEKGQLVPNAQRVALPPAQKKLSPEEIAKHTANFDKQIDNAITDPRLATAAKAAVQSKLAAGDAAGASAELQTFFRMQETNTNSQASREAAAANRSESNEMRRLTVGSNEAQRFNTSEIAKKMQVVDQYAKDANDAYAAIKSGKDPGAYDLEIMRTWAKVTDPLTGVREGEYRDIAGIQGSWRDFTTKLQRIMDNNGGKLDDQSRAQLVSAIQRIRENLYKRQYKPKHNQLMEYFKANNLGGSELVADLYGGREEEKESVAAPAVVKGAPGRRRGTTPPPSAAPDNKKDPYWAPNPRPQGAPQIQLRH